MRHWTAPFVLSWLVVVSNTTPAAAAECDVMAPIRTQWKMTTEMMDRIIAAVPEDKYDFKPVPEVRSFREILVHLITDTYHHMGYAAAKAMSEDEMKKYEQLKTRAELLPAIKESFAYAERVMGGLTNESAMEVVTAMRGEKMPRANVVLSTISDLMDHYGNMVTYLRLNHIVPPRTAERDQQRQKEEKKAEPPRQDPDEHDHGEQPPAPHAFRPEVLKSRVPRGVTIPTSWPTTGLPSAARAFTT